MKAKWILREEVLAEVEAKGSKENYLLLMKKQKK